MQCGRKESRAGLEKRKVAWRRGLQKARKGDRESSRGLVEHLLTTGHVEHFEKSWERTSLGTACRDVWGLQYKWRAVTVQAVLAPALAGLVVGRGQKCLLASDSC